MSGAVYFVTWRLHPKYKWVWVKILVGTEARPTGEHANPMNQEANNKIKVDHLSFWYGDFQAIDDLSLEVRPREVFGLMGPSKSGKSTFLRVLNRMCDLIDGARVEGGALLDEEDILAPDYDLVHLRRRVGLVLSKPVPLPRSILENLILAPRLAGKRTGRNWPPWRSPASRRPNCGTRSRTGSGSALKLSGGQQQRLCIARTLAVGPEVILSTSPARGLDPISTAKIEQTMQELKDDYTMILVTNNTKQAARATDRVAFFLMGELVEVGDDPAALHRPQGQADGRIHLRAIRIISALRPRRTQNASDLNLYYGRLPCLEDVTSRSSSADHHRAHRPLGLRQVHASAHASTA